MNVPWLNLAVVHVCSEMAGRVFTNYVVSSVAGEKVYERKNYGSLSGWEENDQQSAVQESIAGILELKLR